MLIAAGSAVVLGGVALVGCWASYQYYVVDHPGAHLDPQNIRAIIAEESPVFYRDGQTRLGVFFDEQHRDAVAWEELPTAYVASIVAAEDDTFWTHPGIDVYHLGSAIWRNIAAGGMVSGGSTLTQQTAKNLFHSNERSLKRKTGELLDALRLEAHYSKTEILTLYANQFHVSGNGRGIAIGARYFFDKEVDDLTLVECAFLAGLVKGPSNYDPFMGDTDRRERNRGRAKDRTRYVLRRLVEEPTAQLAGPQPTAGDTASELAYSTRYYAVEQLKVDAQALLDNDFEIPFKKGTFRYDTSSLLDEVADRIAEAPFSDVLKAAGITDPASAGLQVITTLDANVQREATYSLWHHLTEVGTQLEGIDVKGYLRPENEAPNADFPVRAHEFRTATVKRQAGKNGAKYLELDLGGAKCNADRDAMSRVALMIWRGKQKDKNAKVSNTWIDQTVAGFPVGSVVWVSVRSVSKDLNLCDLEVRPKLQGSVVVIEDGQVRAMVGGNDNRNYNRAGALRQMGSTWKPLVYHAAIELGWNPTDTLDNRPSVFPWTTVFYYPSADHTPSPEVSLAWAGVNSENIASVWLYYHLTDRLPVEKVGELAEELGLARTLDETPEAYKKRLGKFGVTGKIQEAGFYQAKAQVLNDLPNLDHPEDALPLMSLLYGSGYSSESKRVSRGSDRWKVAALNHSWWALEEKVATCREQMRELRQELPNRGMPPAARVNLLSAKETSDRIEFACGDAPDGYRAVGPWLIDAIPQQADAVDADEPEPESKPKKGKDNGGKKDKKNKPKNSADPKPPPKKPRPKQAPVYVSGPELAPDADVLVDGRLHLGTLAAIADHIAQHPRSDDPFTPENLYWNQDFRVLLGMKYVLELGAQYGIRTEVHEGLTVPLGGEEVTIEEMTSVYDGLVSGLGWDFPGETRGQTMAAPPAPTLLIAEIRDVDGSRLYQANPTSRKVASPETAAMTADILRNVVLYGTGKRAAEAVSANGGFVPVGGKTGTTNDFKNAAFIGFVPALDGGEYAVEGGFTIGVYVGYDDNTPMETGNIKLAGASGALPAWIGTAKGLQDAGLLGKQRSKGSGAWPLHDYDGLLRYTAETSTGLVSGAISSGGPSILARPIATPAPRPKLELPDRIRQKPRPKKDRPKDGRSLWGTPK